MAQQSQLAHGSGGPIPASDAFFAPLKSKDSNRFAHWKGVVFGL
jgi:hypothetical protein